MSYYPYRRSSTTPSNPRSIPPPAPPPLPPERSSGALGFASAGLLNRLLHGTRRQTPPPINHAQELKNQLLHSQSYPKRSCQNASHKTGLKLRALDINQHRTHVVLAGGKILKTLCVDGPNCTEDFNIRNAALNHAWGDTSKSARHPPLMPYGDVSSSQRETFDIEDVAWSNGPFATHVATAASNGWIMLYDLTKPGVEVGHLHDHYRQVHKVDFNPLEGTFLLSGSQDGTVRLWDLRDFRSKEVLTFYSRSTFHGRGDGVRHTKWSPVQTWDFALATDNGTVQRWDTRNTRSPALKISAHYGTCNSIDWHPDGKHLVSAGKDKEVRVWDLFGDKRQKPAFQLRTPQEVQNVRWRPPCLVSGSSDQPLRVQQCTHLATSYLYYPVVHVWDLRRRYIPFREIHHQVNSGTTDMMWQSKDNIWTVGPEGEFSQSDIRHATSTLDRKPLQTFAFAPDGNLTLFVQARPRRRRAKSERTVSATVSTPKATQGITSSSTATKSASKSFGSDSLDENFLSTSLPNRRRSRGSSFLSGRRSLGSTPPSYEDVLKPVTHLDTTMRSYARPARHQISLVGPLDSSSIGPFYKVLAQNYLIHPYDNHSSFEQFTLRCQAVFRNNATLARLAGRVTAMQAYELIFNRISDMLRRIDERQIRKASLSSPASLPDIKHLYDNFVDIFYDIIHHLAGINAVQDAAVLFLTTILTLRRANLSLPIGTEFSRLEAIFSAYEERNLYTGLHDAASRISLLAVGALAEKKAISKPDELRQASDSDWDLDKNQESRKIPQSRKSCTSQDRIDSAAEHGSASSSSYAGEEREEEDEEEMLAEEPCTFASVTPVPVMQQTDHAYAPPSLHAPGGGVAIPACPVCGAAVPSVMVCCRRCKHVAHIGCLDVWWRVREAGGKCPTGGCGCRCWRVGRALDGALGD